MSESRLGGFLGRWSRLKADARQGIEPPTPTQPSSTPAQPTSEASTLAPTSDHANTPTQAPTPAPTLDDVAQLTPQSDFRAFVKRDVASDVKNAAMKKLFTDPHFNVMDGLDVYIDDYSQPDPLAPALLRQMASAKFMNLVEDEADTAATAPVGDNPTQTPPQSVAQSAPDISATDASPPDHDHTDLRLQPDPAARHPDPGKSTA